MDRELTPEEIAELLPAYALDAVDDDERAAIDAYLTSHPEERDALADLQVTASMLAHTGGPPPDGVWERLESIIATTPPPQRIVPPTVLTPRSAPAPERTHPERRWRWLAAAAVVVALAFGGLWLAERGDGGGGAAADTAALAATAATAPGSRHVTLADPGGNALATAVVADRRHRLPDVRAAARAGWAHVSALGHHPHRDDLAGRARSRSGHDRVQGRGTDHESGDHDRGRRWRAGESQRARRGRRLRLTRARSARHSTHVSIRRVPSGSRDHAEHLASPRQLGGETHGTRRHQVARTARAVERPARRRDDDDARDARRVRRPRARRAPAR